jgi:hypothetical protein
MSHIQNNQNPKGNTYQPMDINISRRKIICEPNISRLLPKVCDFQKENHTLGYGFTIFKNL